MVTSKARTKIKQKLSEAEFQKAAEGKELLGRRLKNWKMEVDDETLAALMKKLQYKNVNAFYAAIGDGTVDIGNLKDIIQSVTGVKPAEQTSGAPEADAASQSGPGAEKKTWDGKAVSSDDILVLSAKNVKHLDYKMAKCCNPVYGDDVFGFVSIKDGIKIHRISCPNAARLMEMYPYRIQKVKWSDTPATSSFQTTLRIIAALEPSVINEVIDVINTFKASIRSFNVNENGKNSTYDISVKLSIPSNLELDKVLSQLRIRRGVIKVTRT